MRYFEDLVLRIMFLLKSLFLGLGGFLYEDRRDELEGGSEGFFRGFSVFFIGFLVLYSCDKGFLFFWS